MTVSISGHEIADLSLWDRYELNAVANSLGEVLTRHEAQALVRASALVAPPYQNWTSLPWRGWKQF